jgi:hypothetical protein
LYSGGLYSVDPVAHAVDDGVQPPGDTGVFRDPPIQGERRGVKEPPCASFSLKLLEAGRLPFLQHIGDALDVDDALPVHAQDGVVGLLIGQERAPVPLEGAGLMLALNTARPAWNPADPVPNLGGDRPREEGAE